MRSCNDPTIHDLLHDPLIQLVMRADRVDPLALRRMLGSVALEIESAGRQADFRPQWQNFPPASDAAASASHLCGAC